MNGMMRLNLRGLMLAGVVLAAMALSHREARGDVIYRETFGRPNGSTGNINPSNFSWALFTNNAAHTDAYGISPNIGSPTTVSNVNAGPNADGSFTNCALGNAYEDNNPGNWTNSLSFTPEYSF